MLLVVVLVGVGFMALERVVPDQVLPKVPGWWPRVLLVNAGQLAVVVLAGLSWDRWLGAVSLFELGGLPVPAQAAGGYLVASFVYYWWHRARHESDLLWRLCHQLHQSPSRIETITSFYKHPVELVCNSLLSSALSYTLLGLSLEGAAAVTLVSAVAEFVYHVNVRTPRWLGWFVQRPEMHRVHHERGRHWHNFGDLPVWDLLFGTCLNPPTYRGPCGFRPERELAVGRMLAFENVNGAHDPKAPRRPSRMAGR